MVLNGYLSVFEDEEANRDLFMNNLTKDPIFDTIMRLKHLQFLHFNEKPGSPRVDFYLDTINDYRFFLRLRLGDLINDEDLFQKIVGSQTLCDDAPILITDMILLDKVILEFQNFADIDNRIEVIKEKGIRFNALLVKIYKQKLGSIIHRSDPDVNSLGSRISWDNKGFMDNISLFKDEWEQYQKASQKYLEAVSANSQFPFRSKVEESNRRKSTYSGSTGGTDYTPITVTIKEDENNTKNSGGSGPGTYFSLVILIIIVVVCVVLSEHIKKRKVASATSAFRASQV
jgi:hypothetical protein